MHPSIIVKGYSEALEYAMKKIGEFSVPIDVNNNDELAKVIHSCIGTKFSRRWGDVMTKLALDAVLTVKRDVRGTTEIDIKRYARIEKVPYKSPFHPPLHSISSHRFLVETSRTARFSREL